MLRRFYRRNGTLRERVCVPAKEVLKFLRISSESTRIGSDTLSTLVNGLSCPHLICLKGAEQFQERNPMERTFASEDKRKDQLFKAWNEYLRNVHVRASQIDFEEVYEGSAFVSGVTKNTLSLRLENGQKLRHLGINPEISAHSARLDGVFMTLGLAQGKWWPLNVVSIFSLVNYERGEVHVTLNPVTISAVAQAAKFRAVKNTFNN